MGTQWYPAQKSQALSLLQDYIAKRKLFPFQPPANKPLNIVSTTKTQTQKPIISNTSIRAANPNDFVPQYEIERGKAIEDYFKSPLRTAAYEYAKQITSTPEVQQYKDDLNEFVDAMYWYYQKYYKRRPTADDIKEAIKVPEFGGQVLGEYRAFKKFQQSNIAGKAQILSQDAIDKAKNLAVSIIKNFGYDPYAGKRTPIKIISDTAGLVAQLMMTGGTLQEIGSQLQTMSPVTSSNLYKVGDTLKKIGELPYKPLQAVYEGIQTIQSTRDAVRTLRKYYGIDFDPTNPDELEQAYQFAIYNNHPDIHPEDPNAASKATAINNAYNVLRKANILKKAVVAFSKNLGVLKSHPEFAIQLYNADIPVAPNQPTFKEAADTITNAVNTLIQSGDEQMIKAFGENPITPKQLFENIAKLGDISAPNVKLTSDIVEKAISKPTTPPPTTKQSPFKITEIPPNKETQFKIGDLVEETDHQNNVVRKGEIEKAFEVNGKTFYRLKGSKDLIAENLLRPAEKPVETPKVETPAPEVKPVETQPKGKEALEPLFDIARKYSRDEFERVYLDKLIFDPRIKEWEEIWNKLYPNRLFASTEIWDEAQGIDKTFYRNGNKTVYEHRPNLVPPDGKEIISKYMDFLNEKYPNVEWHVAVGQQPIGKPDRIGVPTELPPDLWLVYDTSIMPDIEKLINKYGSKQIEAGYDIFHEFGHHIGIHDEEEADRFALKMLKEYYNETDNAKAPTPEVKPQEEVNKGKTLAQKLFPDFDIVDSDDTYFYVRKDGVGAITGQLDDKGDVSKLVVEKFGEKSKIFKGKNAIARAKEYLQPTEKAQPEVQPPVETQPLQRVAVNIPDQDVLKTIKDIDIAKHYGNSVPTWDVVPELMKRFNISEEQAKQLLLDLDDKEVIHLQRYDNPSALPEEQRRYLIPWNDSNFGFVTIRGELSNEPQQQVSKPSDRITDREVIKQQMLKDLQNKILKKNMSQTALAEYIAKNKFLPAIALDVWDELTLTPEKIKREIAEIEKKLEQSHLKEVHGKRQIIRKDINETNWARRLDALKQKLAELEAKQKEQQEPLQRVAETSNEEQKPQPKITYQEIAKLRGYKTASHTKPENFLNLEKLNRFQLEIKLSDLMYTFYLLNQKGLIDPELNALNELLDTGIYHEVDDDVLLDTTKTLVNEYFKLVGYNPPYPEAPSPKDTLERLKQIEQQIEAEKRQAKQQVQRVAETPQPETPQTETPKGETAQQETPKQEVEAEQPKQELIEKQQELLNKLKGKANALNMVLDRMSNDLQILYSGDEENAYWVKQKYNLKKNTDKAIDQLSKMIEEKENELEQTKGQINKLKETLNNMFQERKGSVTVPSVGEVSNKVKQFFNNVKQMIYPTISNATRDYEELQEEWRIAINKGIYQAEQIANDLRKLGNDKNLLKTVDDWLDNPQEYETKFVELPQSYQQIGDEIKDIYKRAGEIAKDAGIMDTLIENYTPHIYSDDPTKVFKSLYPKGGKLGKKFSFAIGRSIPTKDEARKLGLHPIEDPILKLQIYLTQLHRTIANNRFLEQLIKTPSEYGLPLVSARPKKKGQLIIWNNVYKPINVPAFKKWAYIGEDKNGKTLLAETNLKAHPDIAPLINEMFAPYQPMNKWLQLYTEARGIVKRALLINPIYHTWNLLTVYLTETNFNPKALAKLFGSIPKDVEERAVNAGLEISKYSNSLREQLNQELRKTNITPLDYALSPITKIEELSDKVLWDILVPRFQIFTFDVLTKKVKQQHPNWTQGQVDGVVADTLNILYGTVPQTWISSVAKKYGPIAALAYRWNIAVFDPLVSATTGGGRGVGTRTFPEWERKFIGSHMRWFVFKSLFAFYVLANLTQAIGIAVVNKLKEKGIIQGDPEPIHFMFDNESGHKFQLDFGLRADDGSKEYVYFPLFKNVQDWIGMIIHPAKTIWNKMEPMLKTAFEAIANYSVGRQQKIVPEGAVWWQDIIDRLGYVLNQLTPSSYYTENKGQAKTPEEWILPLLGMWVSRGSPGGEVEKAMFQFLDQEKTQGSDFDKQVNKLLQQGKAAEAVNLMRENGYSDKQIANRLLKFKMPVMYYWSELSNDKKVKFLQFLKDKYQMTTDDIRKEIEREIQHVREGMP